MAGAMEKYLNRDDVRRQIGVNESVPAFKICNDKTEEDFARRGDSLISTTNQVIYLLDKGISVLIFAGEYDWIWYIPNCSHILNFLVTGWGSKIGLPQNRLGGMVHHIFARYQIERGSSVGKRRA
jgi:hypothetical protein